ncbi:MAG: DUF4445 domain-containing protein [Chloroflexi bacterium]|nr:DUF4445 domain-containing protein [Chloroflexota bacterium]
MVPEGITLLEAARRLGVGIEAICGGRESCNKCMVRVEEGMFPQYDLHSLASHLSPPGERELAFRRRGILPSGYRFSCTARVRGDVLVTVPEESRAQKQVVLKQASGRAIVVDPIVRLHYLELEPTRAGDRADRQRLLCELERRFGLSGVEFDYLALRELSETLHKADGAVTLTVWDQRLVIRVQPGYHEQPLGLAVDVGSTTLAAYLCDLRTGELLATATDMNPQVTYGDDIMSRISYANEVASGRDRLHGAVIRAINQLARNATRQVGLRVRDIVDMTMVGNSVMHHLALNLHPRSLGVAPFIPVVEDALDLKASAIGLRFHPGARLHVLPLEAGFVGADNVGVILSEQPHRQDEVMLVIDVGTNGELLLGNRERLLCTSSPTGPALEGAQITHGMRAAPGAIERIRIDPETLDVRFKVIGEERWSDELPPGKIQARGICGSGIIEAVVELFAAGVITASGRFARGLDTPHLIESDGLKAFVLVDATQSATGSPIVASQRDVRNIQLAKASLLVAAQLLMQEWGVDAVDRIVLAGAFGNVIDPAYALALGMIPPCPLDKITSAGNAAGDGACIALLNRAMRLEAAGVARWVEHVDQPLADEFQSLFMAALSFPPIPEAIYATRRK